MSPPRTERLVIAGPAGALEAAIDDLAAPSASVAVVCHPHPLYGGTMDNKVVTTLGRACTDCGVPAVRFNFRGVGLSAGGYDEGLGEIHDALAVCDFALARWPGRSLILCGFSFGGYIAYEVALKRDAQLLITVAPAVTRFAMSETEPKCRWLLVQGDQDEVVDPKAVLDWARSLGRPPTLKVLSGVGHFFHGRLHDLREVATEAVRNG